MSRRGTVEHQITHVLSADIVPLTQRMRTFEQTVESLSDAIVPHTPREHQVPDDGAEGLQDGPAPRAYELTENHDTEDARPGLVTTGLREPVHIKPCCGLSHSTCL